jgi:hypothetical protein
MFNKAVLKHLAIFSPLLKCTYLPLKRSKGVGGPHWRSLRRSIRRPSRFGRKGREGERWEGDGEGRMEGGGKGGGLGGEVKGSGRRGKRKSLPQL